MYLKESCRYDRSATVRLSRVSLFKNTSTPTTVSTTVVVQMCVVGSACAIQHSAETAYRRQAFACDGRGTTAESTMPRDDCWNDLVTTLGRRCTSRIRGRASILRHITAKGDRGRPLSPGRGATGPNNGLVYAKRPRRSTREEWWWSRFKYLFPMGADLNFKDADGPARQFARCGGNHPTHRRLPLHISPSPI